MYRNSTLYDEAGTTTFRLASSKLYTGQGTNLQNLPDKIRRIYVPDEGKIFCQRDQRGAEALIVAWLCKDGNFRALFKHGIKPHVFVALHLFQEAFQRELQKEGLDVKFDIHPFLVSPIAQLTSIPFWNVLDKLIRSSDDWPAKQRYYYLGKQTCHSANYKVGVFAFILNILKKSEGTIVLTKQEGMRYLSGYFSLFPEIYEWHQEVLDFANKHRMVYNLQGFPAKVTGKIDEKTAKELFAFTPQSTVGTITNIAFAKLQQFIEDCDLDWDLLANTHDSYLCQCPIGQERECMGIMKGFLEQDLVNFRGESFKMGSEGMTGYNWGHYKKGENEAGLKSFTD